ncbi:MAG: hypothetical protein O7E52_28015 [Candidatus Poribacteria bacterium]|nr:hypothetical protein [Candidatus Poribacteria bacterium]
MKQIHRRFFLLSSLCFLSLLRTIFTDASENIPVSTAPDGQVFPRAVDDGGGGTIVVWEDYRTGTDWDVYAQRIDPAGVTLWDASGVGICREKNNQRGLRMVRHGDRAIIVWTDRRAWRTWDVYAQSIDLAGKVLWQVGGMPVCTHPVEQSDINVLSDRAGGVIVVWKDRRRAPAYHDLYVQRIDANGQRMWEADGVPVFPSEALQSNPQLVSDNAGGFYVIWWDVVGDDQWHIMAHHLDLSGKPLWKAPIFLSPLEGMQGEPRAVSDGQGGLIVVWQIYRNFINDDLYAQRIDREGKKRWGESGVPICTAPGIQKDASITSDGSGGMVAVWRDERDIFSDLYAQRIGADGKPQWAFNGISICVAGGHQAAPFLIRHRDREFFIAWLDYREDYGDESKDAIYGQKINLAGEALWAENGIPISTSSGEKLVPYVVRSDSAELTVVWSDARHDLGDIYMQRVK